jgi:YVTN family beta-propeller protein
MLLDAMEAASRRGQQGRDWQRVGAFSRSSPRVARWRRRRTRIAVDAQPIGIAVDPRGSFVYVTSFAMASVSVIDTRSAAVVRKIAVNQGPRAIAVSPDGRFGYVTHSSPTCSVIDLGRVPGGS